MADNTSSSESTKIKAPYDDVEKQNYVSEIPQEEGRPSESNSTDRLYRFLAKGRVEGRGIVPVPEEERTSTRYFNVFTIWLSVNTNILA